MKSSVPGRELGLPGRTVEAGSAALCRQGAAKHVQIVQPDTRERGINQL